LYFVIHSAWLILQRINASSSSSSTILCSINAKLVGCGMGVGFAPTWLRQVSPLLHMTTLTTACQPTTQPATLP